LTIDDLSLVDTSAAAPAPTSAPVISGVAQQGQTLTAWTGTWSGSPTAYAFQWRSSTDNGVSWSAIAGASASSYLPTASDVNKRLDVVVAASNSAGSGSAVSTATAAVAAASATGYDATVLADAPVAFWDMASRTTVETDRTGHGHDGTYKGGTAEAATLPNGEQAIDFNGSNQYLTVPSSSVFSISTTRQLTWEGWIRPDRLQFPNDSGYGYVDWMGKCQNYSPSCEWEARMYNNVNSQGRCSRLSAYVFNPTAGPGSAADWQPGSCTLFQAGKWLHVVAQYQTLTTPSACNATYPGTIDIWVNGIRWNPSYHSPTGCMSQYSVLPSARSSPLNIGTMALETWFAGAVGKVAIYDHLLGQTKIARHYTAMTGAMPIGSCASTCTLS
jgi:hypothetical protein